MDNADYIEFKYYSPGNALAAAPRKEIVHRIGGDANVEDALEAIEDFLKAMGFMLEGRLTIEEKS